MLGKNWWLLGTPGSVVGAAAVIIFSTLPNNCTELLYCFWSGPTSVKSLGTLFILSLNNTILEVLVVSVGNLTIFVAAGSWKG